MFYSGGFLNAVADVNYDVDDAKKANTFSNNNERKPSYDDSFDTSYDKTKTLSNRQRQKLKRKLRKQKAIELSRSQCSNCDPDKAQPPSPQKLRLHQFISTYFRSELNIAENGVGYFIQNAPKVSAHHAIFNGVVRVNGEVTKIGSKILNFGDLVSLEIDATTTATPESDTSTLISWKGSEDVAKKVEDQRSHAERKGRMAISITSSSHTADLNPNTTPELPFIQYYRTRLGRLWDPSIHETAILTPLPMTLRVLKNSQRLQDELKGLGFRPVIESDVRFILCNAFNIDKDVDATRQHRKKEVNPRIMKEFMSNAWIIDQDKSPPSDREARLGVFLSEARISGEILQQELNSMMPVSILVSILKEKLTTKLNCCSFLDLCGAPGSKTLQLITALDTILHEQHSEGQKTSNDFVIVANELNPSRAIQLRQRCFQQCGSRSLSHLIITNTDGRNFDKFDKSTFDFVICDVLCSGDGTIRRSPELVHKWSTKNAEKNKPIQKGLLKVALERLRPGGVAIYSTCSLNPVENDEVVEETLHELNKSSNDEFSLINIEKINGGNGDSSYLRILPASNNGGFFVAAIQRNAVETTLQRRSNTHETSVEVEWKKKHANGASIAYSTSPLTNTLYTQIRERLNIKPVSCGVPVMYRDSRTIFVLQEGSAALNAVDHRVVSLVQLTRLQFGDCMNDADCRRLSIPKSLFVNINEETYALIIRINTTSHASSTFLPARIIEKEIQASTKDIDNDGVIYKVEVIARPQVLKRII